MHYFARKLEDKSNTGPLALQIETNWTEYNYRFKLFKINLFIYLQRWIKPSKSPAKVQKLSQAPAQQNWLKSIISSSPTQESRPGLKAHVHLCLPSQQTPPKSPHQTKSHRYLKPQRHFISFLIKISSLHLIEFYVQSRMQKSICNKIFVCVFLLVISIRSLFMDVFV